MQISRGEWRGGRSQKEKRYEIPRNFQKCPLKNITGTNGMLMVAKGAKTTKQAKKSVNLLLMVANKTTEIAFCNLSSMCGAANAVI